jgi:hypothetical protein
MTIKQLGGVFGRNPTFNDVTIEGQLTFDGDIDINSDLTVDGEVTADGVNISQLTGATLKIESTGAGLGAGSSIGKIDFFGNDASAPGPGVKASIEALTEASLGDDGALVFRTSSGTANNIETARLRAGVGLVLPSGYGIDFSATSGTGTSELLADYEEGVWTVNYAPTTGAFTTITTVGTGRYTKVGRLVTVFGSVRTSGTLDVTGASGNLKITGLPYACNATLGGGGADISHQSWNLGPDILNTRMSVAAGASEILMNKNTMNGSSFPSGNITVADMSTSGGAFSNLITFTASYEV